MRSLIFAGAILVAVASPASAWTQGILYPEGQRKTAVAQNSDTLMSSPLGYRSSTLQTKLNR